MIGVNPRARAGWHAFLRPAPKRGPYRVVMTRVGGADGWLVQAVDIQPEPLSAAEEAALADLCERSSL